MKATFLMVVFPAGQRWYGVGGCLCVCGCGKPGVPKCRHIAGPRVVRLSTCASDVHILSCGVFFCSTAFPSCYSRFQTSSTVIGSSCLRFAGQRGCRKRRETIFIWWICSGHCASVAATTSPEPWRRKLCGFPPHLRRLPELWCSSRREVVRYGETW